MSEKTFAPGPQNADPQRLLSTRGSFLNWSPEEERYWFFSAIDGLDRFRQLVWRHRLDCDFSEVARSGSGLPIYGFRLGRGAKQVVILSGMHGCEPSGPRGMLAYLDALMNGEERFGVRLDRARILDTITLHVFPFINPGGAQRLSLHFPDSWHGTWIPEWTPVNKERFFSEANEPNHFFYGTYVKKAPMRFTVEQIAEWEKTGNLLGSSITDQGLDMWFDWDDTHGVQTKALKEIIGSIRPFCVADFHNFMYPTEVFAPTAFSKGDLAKEENALALALQAEWRARGLPYNQRAPRPYPKPPEKDYEDYWFHQLGARTLIVEFNGGMLATEGAEYDPKTHQRALTRHESLASVFFAARALVDHLAENAG
ncbi:MAG: M14 family zinc carboxypeptidase [Acidobacteriaceae bacterium]